MNEITSSFGGNMKRVICTAVALFLTGCAGDPIQEGYVAFNSGNCATALEKWLPQAKLEHPVAENNMGVLWENGCGVPRQDYKEAMAWYERSASHGNALAVSNIGKLYENGFGVEKNVETAVRYYGYAARLGEQTSVQALLRLNYPVPQKQIDQSAQVANTMPVNSDGTEQVLSTMLEGVGSYYESRAERSRQQIDSIQRQREQQQQYYQQQQEKNKSTTCMSEVVLGKLKTVCK